MLVIWTLWLRELVRFYREKARVIGALVPPLIFWVAIGAGLGDSFSPPGAPEGINYLQYFFPGTVLLVVLFTSVFATISLVEDRKEGFLQSVLVAPVSRGGIVAGKILGASTLGFLQGLIFLCLAPAAGLRIDLPAFIFVLLVLALASAGLAGLGFAIAWRLNSTQGFHAVMNLFLIPMWMMSGSLFPADGAPFWMRAIVAVNPLSYAVAGMQNSFIIGTSGVMGAGPSRPLCLAVLAAFAAVTFVAGTLLARRGSA
jgi:ABC-2 type transport system permease protein